MKINELKMAALLMNRRIKKLHSTKNKTCRISSGILTGAVI